MNKILIVDDHPSFIEGLKALLESVIPDVVLMNAADGESALLKLKRQPDIDWAFIDINLPGFNGLELVNKLAQNKIIVNIVVMSGENNIALIDHAIKSHVNGFLSKNFDRQTLVECIKVINNGHIFLTPDCSRELSNYRDSLLREKELIEAHLSHRLNETLELVSKGFSNQEIAQILGITESTVKTHVSRLIALFEADNRTHCVVEARRLRFVE